jgi:hypothetical protein
MAALMSLVMFGVGIQVNAGLETGIVERWIQAYAVAFPRASLAPPLIRPLATLTTRK